LREFPQENPWGETCARNLMCPFSTVLHLILGVNSTIPHTPKFKKIRCGIRLILIP